MKFLSISQLCLIATFVFCSSSTLLAQDARSSFIQAQRNNWVLRVSAGADSIPEGTVRGVFSDTVLIGSTRVALASVTRVDRRKQVGGGGTAGALVGGAIVGLLGLVVASELCEPNCSFIKDSVAGFGIGATLGGTVGGLIGGITKPSQAAYSTIWPQ